MNTEIEDDFEFRKPSRSQRKRDAEALTELGKKLIALPAKKLNTLPIEDSIKKELLAAQKMGHGALKRQIQHIGKRLRQQDEETLAPLLALFN